MPFQEKEFDEPTLAIQTRIPESLYHASVELSTKFGLTKSKFAYVIYILGWEAFDKGIRSGRLKAAVDNLEDDLKPKHRKKLLQAIEEMKSISIDIIRETYKLDEYYDATDTDETE